MPWGVAAGAAIAAGGAYLQGQSAADAAEAQANAYNNLSQQQWNAAQSAAGMVPNFTPVTVTSSFGTPSYTYNDQGVLTGVKSTAAPWLAALQQQGQGLAGGYMDLQQQALQNQAGYNASNQAFGASGNLYNLAASALPSSYNIADKTQEYYDRMQQLVAPEREKQLATTRQGLFNSGRAGLAIGATQEGGQLATNPEMAAYYNAIAQQDLGLANQAEQQALSNLSQQQQMALGLFNAGSAQTATGGNALQQYYGNILASQQPYAGNMAQLTAAENMINAPVQQGMQYGGLVTNQANNIANAYMQASGAGSAAAMQGINAQYQADAYNPWAGVLMGAGQAIGGANWGSVFNSPSASTGTSSFNQAASNYGSGTQQFGAPASGWSYGGFNTSGKLY